MTTANLTIADNDTVVQYTSTGETEFAIPFPFLADAEIAVSVDQVDKVLGTDFTLAGAGDESGGTCTFAAATTAGEVITIWLDMPIKRLTGFNTGAATLLGEDLNAEFVRQVRQDQMLRRDIRRALRIAPDDPNAGQDMEIPTSTARAGKVLAFNGSGNPTVIDVTGSEDTSLRADLASTDASKGNELLAYVITTSESNAGLTIVNAHYPPGHVYRYGTNTTPGTTDMAVALTAAFNSGHPAIIPPEQIAFGSTIVVDAVLDAEGYGDASQLICTASVVYGIALVEGNSGHRLRNFRLTGSSPAQGGSLNRAIAVGTNAAGDTPSTSDHVVNATFRDLLIDAWNSGISNAHGSGLRVYNCRIFDMIGTDAQYGYGIQSSGDNCAFEHNWIENDPTDAEGRHAIYVTGGATNVKIRFNRVRGYQRNTLRIRITSGTGRDYDVSHNELVECLTAEDDAGYVATIGLVFVNGGSGFQVAHNIMDQCGGSLVYLDEASYGKVCYNQAIDAVDLDPTTYTPHGVMLENTCSHIDVVGNENDNIDDSGTSHDVNGVQVSNDSSYINVLDNRFGGDSFDNVVRLSSTVDYCYLRGNRAVGTPNTSVIENASSGTNNKVIGEVQTYTGTLTGCATAPTGTIKVVQGEDTLWIELDQFSATSNATAKTITGMPAPFRPASTVKVAGIQIRDNGTDAFGMLEIDTSGVITLYPDAGGGNWTSSGAFVCYRQIVSVPLKV